MSSKGERSIKDTINDMRKLLAHITTDLEKSDNGNKAASQRVRTGTVKLEKVAKHYRKVSIQHEKSTKGHKKTAKKAAKGKAHARPAAKAKAKHAAKGHHAHAKKATKPAAKHTAKKAAKPAAKSHKASKPSAFALRRPTAKLPTRRAH
jgi:peptidoglycan hydrolase CwlO-like protein